MVLSIRDLLGVMTHVDGLAHITESPVSRASRIFVRHAGALVFSGAFRDMKPQLIGDVSGDGPPCESLTEPSDKPM